MNESVSPTLAPSARAGITEDLIDRQVRTFYGKIRQDAVLGPIFERVISDWEPHLLKMTDFWSSVLLGSRRYRGNPVARHAPLALRTPHFQRWLELFSQTAGEVCPPDAADLFRQRAGMIAQSLQLAMGTSHGGLPMHPQAGQGA